MSQQVKQEKHVAQEDAAIPDKEAVSINYSSSYFILCSLLICLYFISR